MTARPTAPPSPPTPAGQSLAAMPCYTSSCGRVTLYLGDSLAIAPTLEGVDALISDPPYGMTDGKWDTVPDLAKLWEIAREKVAGACVMTASQPFTTDLINSNRADFRYSWVWDKGSAANFASVAFMPLRIHEDVLVFRKGAYNPQRTQGPKNHSRRVTLQARQSENIRTPMLQIASDQSGMKWPTTILSFPKHTSRERNHPTEKPVPLFAYLVETYSDPGATVLDPFMGSGTTGIACIRTGRRFIGIERDPDHYAEAKARIANELAQGDLFLGCTSSDGTATTHTPRL